MYKNIIILFVILCTLSCTTDKNIISFDEPVRGVGQKDVISLALPPIDTVRVGFIGLGMRGPGAVERFTYIDGVKIVALCDIEPERVDSCQAILSRAGLPQAVGYSGDAQVWKELCNRDDIDLVYICTDWLNHTPMALYAMEQGKNVACEVPIAMTLEECWALVDMAEKKQVHCMQLENCCYDFFEMSVLNMAQKGLLGEVMHVEGAYIHDLRYLNFLDPKDGGYHDWWRLRYNETHTGNPYPTHGLGPVTQVLNIGRGDRMEYLVSLSSDQAGMTEYAKNKFGEGSEYATYPYKLGDMNTTLIKTAKGKSIMIQHDVTSPRPYNRKFAVSGTKGYAEKYPRPGIALDPKAHSFLQQEQYDSLMQVYEHPITKEVGELARKVGGHGGMDFIMDYRLIYCLRNGLPLDMNVYDGVEWCSVTPLSEISVNNNSAPVKMPDFTRGGWKVLNGYSHAIAK